MITKNLSICKYASTKLLNPIDIGSGNIIPNWWSTILTTGGKAYTMAIALLSELWFLYRSTGQEEHQKDYDYFCNKFNLSTYQVMEAFIGLIAEVNSDAKKITLKAPTKFIKDLVQSNYLQLIDKIFSMQNYNLSGESICTKQRAKSENL